MPSRDSLVAVNLTSAAFGWSRPVWQGVLGGLLGRVGQRSKKIFDFLLPPEGVVRAHTRVCQTLRKKNGMFGRTGSINPVELDYARIA